MRRVLHAAVLLLLVTGIAPDVWAGAWTLPKGRTFLEYFYRVFQAKKDFNEDGNSSRKAAEGDPTQDEAAWMLFHEAMAAAEELAESYYGFRPVVEETFAPVLAAADEAPARDAAPPAAAEREVRYNKVAFINLEGAFNARNEDPANEFPMVAEAGFTPFKRLMLVGSVEATVSVNSTHEQIENFAKWGLRAIFNLRGDGFASVFRRGERTVNVEVGYNDIFAGRNTADAYELFGKLSVVF